MKDSAGRTRVWMGLILLVLGVLFLVDNLTGWEIPWGDWWPVILIVVGLSKFVGRKSSWVGGVVITGLGVIFLLVTLDVWGFSFGDIWRFWPVILVIVGMSIIFGGRKARSKRRDALHSADDSTPGELNVSCVFGETSQTITDRALSGGEVTSVFGNARVDLRGAGLAAGGASLNVTAVFGGVVLAVPPAWSLQIETTNILGGVTDNRPQAPPDGSGERVTITGACLFGHIGLES